MTHDIQVSTFVFAPPDEVMELITNPDFIQEWGGKNAVVEKRAGGRFEMFDGWASGEILKISEDEFSFTWKTTDWSEEAPASIVTMKLEASGKGTEVKLEQKGLPTEEEATSHKSGWMKFYFEPIGEYLANRKFG